MSPWLGLFLSSMAMDFLRKMPQIEWRAFGLIVFFAAYVTAVISVLAPYSQLEATASLLATVLVSALVLMTIVFGLSRVLKRTDVVDAAWAVACITAVVTSFLLNQHQLQIGYNVQTVATTLVFVWGVRLSYHIIRRLLARPEDPRYIELRKNWKGNEVISSYIRIFVLQAVLAVAVASAVVCVNLSEPAAMSIGAWIGVGVWIGGFVFEAVGDRQLRRFTKQQSNRGKLMTTGLWRYTRHPNYFGEAVQWWGLFIMALTLPMGWAGVLSPVLITYLLLYISGVPLAEKALEKKRGWKAYAARTSIFVPRLPRRR